MHSQTWARIRVFAASAAVVALMAAPASAADDRLEDEMRQMRELVLQLQDQVQDQQGVLDEQGDVIRDAGLEERSSGSRLSNFLQTTDFSGSIAASYFYNINKPGSGPTANGTGAGAGGNGNNTVSGTMNPWHPDHNSIQLDEVWMSMSRSASDETPVGFGIDLVYGALGEVNGSSSTAGGGNGFWLNQAYIDYMPISGWTLTAGKFNTHIGYEVAGAANNVMITRGFTYNLMQPVSQIGAKLTAEFDGGFTAMLGVTNGLGENQVDFDSPKDVIWQLGWANDQVTVLFNGEWGGDTEFFAPTLPLAGGSGGKKAIVLDTVVEFAPTDTIVTWLDVTWAHVQIAGGSNQDLVGINVGGRIGLGDKAGIGARGEWGTFDSGSIVGVDQAGTFSGDTDMWSITGTFDYLLAEGLTAKAELQYVGASVSGPANSTSALFPGTSGNNQVIIGAQLIYVF